MNLIPSNFSSAPIRPLLRTLAANADESFDVFGSAFYVKEAEYPVEVAFDEGDFLPWDLAIGIDFARQGFAFKRVRIRNLSAAANRVEAYAGFFTIDDKRLNIVESRNGSPASQIPTGYTETEHTFASGAAVELLALDYSRVEVWLAADTFGTSWFGPTEVIMNGPSGTADFRRVGLSFDGFTKLRTKSAIWVRGNIGATVRAKVFTF